MARNMGSMRRQHAALTDMLLRLVNMVEGHRPGDEAYPISLQLARLIGLLRSHLASEDEWLYPAMIASHERRAAELAEHYRREMGGLAERVEAFERRWSSSSVVAAAFEAFRGDAKALFAAIDERIAREDSQLYPAADSVGLGTPTPA